MGDRIRARQADRVARHVRAERLPVIRGELLRFGVWAGLLVVIGFVVFVGGTYPWLGSQAVRLATHVALGSVLVGWLVVMTLRPEWRPRSATIAPIALVLAIAAASAAASPVPRVALASLVQGGATALLFLFLTRLAGHPWFRPRLTVLLVILPVLVIAGYLGQVGEAWIRWWQLVGHVSGPPLRPDAAALTFGATPVVAALVLLLGPFAVVSAGMRARPLAALLAATALAAIVISGSRAAYLGLAFAGLAAGLLVLARSRRTWTRSIRSLGRVWIVPAAAGVLATVAVGRPLLARILDLNTVGERVDLWASAMVLFSERPLLGTGPGTWPVLKYAANPPGVPNLVVPHAHSNLVESVAELGILGLAGLGVLAILIASRLFHAARPGQPDSLRMGATAASIGLTGLAAMSVVDNFANLLAVVVPVLLLVAWVIGGLDGWSSASTGAPGIDPSAPRPPKDLALARRGFVGSIATLAVVVSIIPIVARVDDAALTAESGARAADRGAWAEAAVAFRRAVAVDPDQPAYWMQLGAALATTGELAAARAEYTRLVAVDGYAMNLLSLAWLDVQLGDRVAALQNAKTALARGTGDPVIALNVGAVAEAAGDLDMAVEAYGKALVMLPELGAASYWSGRVLPAAQIFDAARASLASAGSPPGSIAAELLRAYLGDPEGAEAVILALDPSPARERAVAICLSLQGRFVEAIERVRAVLRAEPLDGQSAALLARLEADAGDTAAAARHAEWARLIGVGATAQVTTNGGRVATAWEVGRSGQPANYPWMIYLRFTTQTLTPPSYLVVAR